MLALCSSSSAGFIHQKAHRGAVSLAPAHLNLASNETEITSETLGIKVLMADPSTAQYWVGGAIPEHTLLRETPKHEVCIDSAGNPVDSGHKALQEVPFCQSFWPQVAGPLVYDIGIGGDFDFDDFAVDEFDATVHAYDPTIDLHQQHASHNKDGVNFHFQGLAGATAKQQQQQSGNSSMALDSDYGSVDPRVMTTLVDMLQSNADHSPNIFAVDCEGCEWASFEQIARSSPNVLSGTKLVYLECHTSTNLLEPTPAQFVALFDYLLNQQGFKIWYLHQNHGFPEDRTTTPWLQAVGLVPGIPAYELAFVRP